MEWEEKKCIAYGSLMHDVYTKSWRLGMGSFYTMVTIVVILREEMTTLSLQSPTQVMWVGVELRDMGTLEKLLNVRR
jgi:hypothetical protein